MLPVVYTLKKFRSYFLGTKVISHTDHTSLHYFMAKKYAKSRFLRWVLLLGEFNFEVKNHKGCENQVANHFSILEGREYAQH